MQSLIRKSQSTFSVIGVIRDCDTTCAGRHVLGLLQAKAPNISKRPDQLALVFREMGLGTILNHDQIMLSSDLENRVHICRIPEQMDSHNRSRFLCDVCLNAVRIEIVSIRQDIGKDRDTILIDNRQNRTEVCDWGRNNLIAGGRVNHTQGSVN